VNASLVLVFSSEHTNTATTQPAPVMDKQASATVRQLSPVVEHVTATAVSPATADITVQTNFEGSVYWALIRGYA
jgi:hypothetical protein